MKLAECRTIVTQIWFEGKRKDVKVALDILEFRFTHLYYERALTMIAAIVFVDFTRKKTADRMAEHQLSLIVHI